MLIALLVFIGLFPLLALLPLAMGLGSGTRSRQTQAHLKSALFAAVPTTREQIVNLRKDEVLSAIPWIDRFLRQLNLATRLRILLYQADVHWTAAGLILAILVFLFVPAYLVYLRTGQILPALAAGTLCACAPLLFLLRRRARRFAAFEQKLPEALELMVSALRAGHSLISALRLAAQECPEPVGAEFRLCFEEQNYGLELRAAFENMVARMPVQDLRIVATAILIQKESGGNLAEVLDRTAQIIRERFKLKRQVRVHTAQGRLTGWILSLLPFVLGAALYCIDPRTISILWTRPLGLKLLAASAVMTIVGGLAIRHIVNMET